MGQNRRARPIAERPITVEESLTGARPRSVAAPVFSVATTTLTICRYARAGAGENAIGSFRGVRRLSGGPLTALLNRLARVPAAAACSPEPRPPSPCSTRDRPRTNPPMSSSTAAIGSCVRTTPSVNSTPPPYTASQCRLPLSGPRYRRLRLPTELPFCHDDDAARDGPRQALDPG